MQDGQDLPSGTDAALRKAPASIAVWDLPTRLFHWSLVALVTGAWATGGTGMRWHEVMGFTVAGLLMFRIAWGFIGNRHSRFSDFVASPRSAVGYVKGVARLTAPRHLGHNPAGGLMILLLLCVLATLSVTGTMMLTNQFFGVPWVETLHKWSADALLALIPLHVLGVVVSSWMHQENLVGAMLSGFKPVKGQHGEPAPATGGGHFRIEDRLRGIEGLVILLFLASGGGLVGWLSTNGRQSAENAVVPQERTTAFEEKTAAATIDPAIALAVQAAASARDREDYIAGGPDEGSRAWLIASGGRLYDNWYVALGKAGPATKHPSWPASNTNVTGAATWRCKSCHGWDYLGREGQYGTGTDATGIIGIGRMRGRDPEAIARILGNPTHQFTDELIPPHARYRIALFVAQGQHLFPRAVEKGGQIRGNLEQGRALFQTVCAACHGFDGRARRLGISARTDFTGPGLYVGTKANANPAEVLHKIRNGHPGAIMISLRGLPVQYALDVLRYVQTLPTE